MSQEQNNDIKITLTDEELALYGGIKDQLIEEIKQELITAGFEPVPQHYDGGADIASLVDKANQLKVAFEEEKATIKDTYSEKVAAEKIKVLEVDHRMDMESLASEIDNVVAKDQQFRDIAMKELVNAEGYKTAKMECFEVMNILRNTDANYEIIADVIQPLVAAKDISSLKITRCLTKDASSQYLIDKAIDNITAYKANAELTNFADTAKAFIIKGDQSFTLHTYMYQYTNKGDDK